jgi:hypothetical protein
MTLIKIARSMAMPNRNIDCDAESDSDAGCSPERVKKIDQFHKFLKYCEEMGILQCVLLLLL